ncbi:MraY family glycosyltransferase [Spirulina major]|uniref:MraY family glycosyltransferase n=1 Tax=Spirulina major TaxID=270636 RepID=UPI000934D52A|nr:glycosyltransferase family 4 protein [Spirulina major]
MNVLVFVSISLILALSVTGWLRSQFQIQLLDIPNDRSSHTQPTPRGGGLGFIVAFLLMISSMVAFDRALLLEVVELWAVLLPLAIAGFLDDRYNLPARVRYLVQLGAAAIAVYAFATLPIPGLSGLGSVGQWVGFGVTLIAFTAIINFYNFMDGLDGLVASVTALQLGFLAVYLQQPLWWLLVGALCGFLYWNWSPAKIFMGDVGSTVLGAAVAIALLNATDTPQFWPACAIMIPLLGDAVYTLMRRLLNRENIFQAHRSHLYQRLQQSGWSHGQVAITYLILTGAIALLIGQWGGIGAGLGLGLGGGAIALGEVYLYYRQSVTR